MGIPRVMTCRVCGVTEPEAIRLALAAEVEHARGERVGHWLTPFLQRELDYLRRTETVRAKLDAWQPVAGMVNTTGLT